MILAYLLMKLEHLASMAEIMVSNTLNSLLFCEKAEFRTKPRSSSCFLDMIEAMRAMSSLSLSSSCLISFP